MVARIRIAWRPDLRDRVCICSDPDRELGTVVKAGSEQSEVKWDTGLFSVVPNTWLEATEQ